MGGVRTLLEVGGSIDIRDSAQRTLLHRACEEVTSSRLCTSIDLPVMDAVCVEVKLLYYK